MSLATEQYYPVVLIITLHKVILTFESVDKFLACDHSNESCRTVLSYVGCCFTGISRIFLRCVRIKEPERGWGGHFHTFLVHPDLDSALLYVGRP